MIATEFDGIKRILKGRYNLFEDNADVFRWYEELKGFDYSVVKEAVNDWIINDGWKPEVVNIVERCKDVIRWNAKIKAAQEPNVKTISCPHCRDSGLIITTSPTGIDQGRPCTFCPKGRQNYPWYFLTQQEKDEYNAKEIKAGRSVPIYHYAPDDFRQAYLYGESPKK